MDQTANDMVLGTSAYKTGIRATMLSPKDRGIGYLVGAGDDPAVVRTYYVDAETAERVAERARAARERAGTITGYAAGEDVQPMTPAASLLDDLRTIFATAEVTWAWSEDPWAWSEDLVQRLAAFRPDVYAQWDVELFARSLRAIGVETKQLNRTGPDGRMRNLRGIEAEQLVAAIPATRSTDP
jgi:S-DNA-T family DNA segregation ATPase FtsK/SpoIIIE